MSRCCSRNPACIYKCKHHASGGIRTCSDQNVPSGGECVIVSVGASSSHRDGSNRASVESFSTVKAIVCSVTSWDAKFKIDEILTACGCFAGFPVKRVMAVFESNGDVQTSSEARMSGHQAAW